MVFSESPQRMLYYSYALMHIFQQLYTQSTPFYTNTSPSNIPSIKVAFHEP